MTDIQMLYVISREMERDQNQKHEIQQVEKTVKNKLGQGSLTQTA